MRKKTFYYLDRRQLAGIYFNVVQASRLFLILLIHVFFQPSKFSTETCL
jgi:hypothetical protein